MDNGDMLNTINKVTVTGLVKYKFNDLFHYNKLIRINLNVVPKLLNVFKKVLST